MPLHLHAGEEQLQVEGHHLLEGNGGEDRLGFGGAQLSGQFDKPRQVFLRDLDPGELLNAAVGIADQGRDVQAEVADEGEGVCGVHRQRGEHREDGALEVVVDPGLLLFVQQPVVQ